MFRKCARAAVVAPVALFVALGGTAFGAAPARAQSARAHRGDLHVSAKTVETFIRRRARVVGLGQTPLFPNARIYKTGAFATCSALTKWRRWVCGWNAYVYEESKRDPGPFQVRQSTFRYCTAAAEGGGFGTVEVKRARSSRRLRLAGPWLVSCDLTEDSIRSWNVFAYSEDQVWQPTRSEPLQVAQSTLPPPQPVPHELLPPPAGQPAGPPPGPLSMGPAARPASAAIAQASSITGVLRNGASLGCSPWMRYVLDARYWVFYCYWRPPSAATLPGAALGVFSQDVVTYWEGYYWAENDNYGRPTGKLFASGEF